MKRKMLMLAAKIEVLDHEIVIKMEEGIELLFTPQRHKMEQVYKDVCRLNEKRNELIAKLSGLAGGAK